MDALVRGLGVVVCGERFGAGEGRVDPEAGEELEVLEELVGVAEAGGGDAGRRREAPDGAECGGVGG